MAYGKQLSEQFDLKWISSNNTSCILKMMSTNDEIPSELFEYSATSANKTQTFPLLKLCYFFQLLAEKRPVISFCIFRWIKQKYISMQNDMKCKSCSYQYVNFINRYRFGIYKHNKRKKCDIWSVIFTVLLIYTVIHMVLIYVLVNVFW